MQGIRHGNEIQARVEEGKEDHAVVSAGHADEEPVPVLDKVEFADRLAHQRMNKGVDAFPFHL